jgi:hypothetical protein
MQQFLQQRRGHEFEYFVAVGTLRESPPGLLEDFGA